MTGNAGKNIVMIIQASYYYILLIRSGYFLIIGTKYQSSQDLTKAVQCNWYFLTF